MKCDECDKEKDELVRCEGCSKLLCPLCLHDEGSCLRIEYQDFLADPDE